MKFSIALSLMAAQIYAALFCFGLMNAQAIANDSTMEGAVTLLVIDLQDGFADDTVVINANGREVFHKGDVTTNYALGRADAVEIQIPEGQVDVEVDIPSRRLSDTITLEVSDTVYLGISIIDNKIEYRISGERFLYF